MREFFLIIHFIGLAMGLGTSFGYMFLGIASSKMEKGEAIKFLLNSFALSRMGQTGLALLVVSGIYLIIPYLENLADSPLLITKLILVIILGAIIGVMGSTAKKAKQGNAEIHLKKIKTMGRISLLTTLTIVVLAVLNFD